MSAKRCRRGPLIGLPIGFIFLILILWPLYAWTQDTVTGAFEGRVFSSVNGTYIPGAAVEITSESTGVVRTQTADSNGRFYQGLLAPEEIVGLGFVTGPPRDVHQGDACIRICRRLSEHLLERLPRFVIPAFP